MTGGVTVPVLWDTKTKRIVNNCEDDICRMFNDVFNDFARNKTVDLFPKEIQADHAKLSDFIYDNVNNGVYRAGFATRQRPYERACRRVFEALDELEQRLSKSRYLFANRIVEAMRSQVCEMARDLDEQVAAFRTRPLDAGPYTFVAADALTMKVREGGRVVNVQALLATGVNADGHREVLGVRSPPPRTAPVAGVLPRPRRPRPGRGRAGHQRCAPRPGRGDRREPARRRPGKGVVRITRRT